MAFGVSEFLTASVFFLSICNAQDNCAVYGTMAFTSPTIPGANHTACFEACATNPQCYYYNYNGICTLTLLSTRLNPALNVFTVGFVICPNDPSHCVASTGYTAIDDVSPVTNQECFNKCASNSTCVYYLYNAGKCTNKLLTGDVVDTNSEINTEALIRCKMPETTTQSSLTTSTTTTTSRGKFDLRN
ncbi:uncharacterized protein LOC131939927 [Physella acuta]|uniref:uncharacterized protein LOC131939927 n=1 Tax=Physella acuta TaxID=109671 RepID=UPI0027DDA49C|nr:uncharacterized protein LOC131939927 [Physella acuta]